MSRLSDADLKTIFGDNDPNAPSLAQPESAPVESEGPGFLGTVADMGKGVAAGVWDAGAETVNLIPDIANKFREDGEKFDDIVPSSDNYITLETGWGRGTKAISQFVGGFVGAGKILKAGQILQGAGKAATIARGATQGAITDFVAFDGHDANLADLVESFPALGNPITEYLASDPKDDKLEGRFKNSITGLVPGVLGEALFVTVAARRAAKAARTQKELDAINTKATDKLEELSARSGKPVDELVEPVEAIIGGDTRALSDAVTEAGGKVELSVHGVDEGAVRETVEHLAATNTPQAGVTKGVVENAQPISPEEFVKVYEKGLADGRSLEEIYELGVNTGRGTTFDSVEQARLHRAYAEAIHEHTLKGKGVEPFDYLRTEAQEWLQHIGIDKLTQAAAGNAKILEKLNIDNLAYRMGSKNIGDRLMHLWDSASLQGKNALDSEEFVRLSKAFQDLDRASADAGTAFARGLNARKIDPIYLPPETMVAVLKATGGSSEEILRVINGVQRSKALRFGYATMEAVINGMLSGVKTHLANTGGNGMKALLMPIDTMIGGAMMLDKKVVMRGAYTFSGLFRYLGESWSAFNMARRAGENILDAGNKILDNHAHQPIFTTYDRIKKDMLLRLQAEGKDVSNGLSPLMLLQARMQSFMGYPSRALLSMDEFFKQINYRAHLHGKFTEEGLANGMRGKELGAFIEKRMRASFDATGRGTDASGLRYAQEATWTQSTRDGAYLNVAEGVSALANALPPARLVVPFIKTPTNLYRDFVAHTPGINLITKRFHDGIRAGGEERARVLGATATGSMLWISAISMAMSGRITGGYPKDPAARQAWIDSGIEPYSFRFGDTYLSFARLEPFAAMFGIAADMHEYAQNWEDTAKNNIASNAMVALAHNLTSKSYLTGITELMGALTDDTADSRKMTKYMQRISGMLIPYSGLLRFGRQTLDDPIREVRGIFDNIQNSIPYASSGLPEKRSWITGKHISNNVFWGEHKHDLVTNELANLGDNLSIGAPPRVVRGVELSGEQYGRFCELQGTTKIGGLTQQERLERLMKSPAYDLGRKRLPDMPGDAENPRTNMVKQIVSQYRRKAQNDLLTEDAELRRKIDTQRQAKSAAKRGDRDKYTELLTMPTR